MNFQKLIMLVLAFMLPVAVNAAVVQEGEASYYSDKLHGNKTASGEIYDMNKLTAAHKKLPFNTIVEITNLTNQNKVIVRINDRGPFVKNRIIDLSYKAAKRLGMEKKGTSPVSIKIVKSLIHKRNITNYPEDIKYVLQAGAFAEKSNAKRMKIKINIIVPELKFDIYFKNGFYRVISERIGTRLKAEKYKKILTKNNVDVFIKKIE